MCVHHRVEATQATQVDQHKPLWPAAVIRATARSVLVVLLFGLSSAVTTAQVCTALAPSGDTSGLADWNNINNCLNGDAHSVTLQAGVGRFYVYKPIQFPQLPGVKLLGNGNTSGGSAIQAVYSSAASSECLPAPSCFVAPSGNPRFPYSYIPVILTKNAPNGQISNFFLDLSDLRKSNQHVGNFAIQIGTGSRPSPGTQITSLKIVGSRFGDPGYTTGWANGGGIRIVSSSNCVVANNAVKDLGYTTELGSLSVGAEGIRVENSGSTLVQDNTVTRTSFGIEVVNNRIAIQPGDSSYTVISGNNITGAAGIGCPDCSGARSIKLEANGDALPLRYLRVQSNTATNWGGANRQDIVPSGLDLSGGVQYGTFSGNSFIGDNNTSYALEIRSGFMGPQSASHHNVFTSNTFFAALCEGCHDVFFTPDGPDQGSGGVSGTPSIGRHANAGGNIFRPPAASDQDRGCSQFAHAWWQYPAGQAYVSRGQNLTVAAAGIRPDVSKPVLFVFTAPNGNTILTSAFAGGNGSCVMNQQSVYIDPALFTVAGSYRVYASYWDGNSDARIVGDYIGTAGQQTTLEIR